jgi:hypothetical protein
MVARGLLALVLLLAPLGAWRAAPAAGLPVCTADGGVRLVPDPAVPDPTAPGALGHGHCDACLVVPPALPVPPGAAWHPRAVTLDLAPGAARAAAPANRPPERARGPPAT